MHCLGWVAVSSGWLRRYMKFIFDKKLLIKKPLFKETANIGFY